MPDDLVWMMCTVSDLIESGGASHHFKELGENVNLILCRGVIPYVWCGNGTATVTLNIEHTGNMNAPCGDCMEFQLLDGAGTKFHAAATCHCHTAQKALRLHVLYVPQFLHH